MSRDVCETVEQPPYSEGEARPFLGKIGESLSVLCSYKTGTDVWVMKESCWQKLMILDDVVFYPRDFPSLIPLCISPEGEILLMGEWIFLIYDKDNWYRKLGKYHALYEADIYVESLVQLELDTHVADEVKQGKEEELIQLMIIEE
ncbi:hypothetical protein C2S53_004112 [Perilla frutescens var. hirtella]|uniref:F-box protein n=1 Tax=Perilla frutescens var. hirtella TaxID=608512 RepID=A0AAD4JIJ2_PERFH|nr:hypothetical protein C2S51_016248 [Perilla frutescens var. frutescens]KAH6834530.1 hypothetical protein C2S53_004112 [Perilla frutescens var. hirtella]